MFKKVRVGPYIKPRTGRTVKGYDYIKDAKKFRMEAIEQKIDEMVGNARTNEELYEAQEYFKSYIGGAYSYGDLTAEERSSLYAYLSARSAEKMRELLEL